MPAAPAPSKGSSKTTGSRSVHSALLRRKQERRAALAESPTPENPSALAAVPAQAPDSQPAVSAAAGQGILVRGLKQGLVVEQTLRYSPGHSRPVVEAHLRLSTAVRGARKADGLIETACLLRLEIIALTPGCQVTGFSLGPWRAEGLKLEAGSMHLANPLWSAFQAVAGEVRGRVLITDLTRHRVLDLPWKTQAVLPSGEPFAG